MARDHALARAVGPDEVILRLYRWAIPTVSFGRNEPAGGYDGEAIEAAGFGVVRRPTGGRAVLHHRELTYSVVTGGSRLGRPKEIFRSIHGALRSALASLGVPAEIGESHSGTLAVDAGPCFASAAGGEVVVNGRKLVGSAQRRMDGATLQHGSILVADDQGTLDHFRRVGATLAGAPGTACIEEFVGHTPRWTDIEAAIVTAFEADFGANFSEIARGRFEGEHELTELYESEEWTWRGAALERTRT